MTRNFSSSSLLLALALALSLASAALQIQVPRLDLPPQTAGYHGLVDEDKLVVDVTPKIRVVGADVCSFRIVNKHHAETPFEIVLKDRDKGEAELRAKKTLNCEKRKNYKFDIVAVSCAGVTSDNATVHISVNDVNEFAPVFAEPSYVVDIDEGRDEDKVIQVEATDSDCSAKYGDVCRYEIANAEAQPFSIDNEGVIRNTEPLDYEKNHNHILQVMAYDCGMKRSIEPVLVNIKVNRVCRLGWTGIPERVEYVPGSGRQDLFPEAQLNLCDFPCQPESIQARITLATTHLGKSCDRDTYTVQNQRQLCDANSRAVDLLPPPGPGAEWTKDLPIDPSRDADQVYLFDGSTGVKIPDGTGVTHNIGKNFTISLWLKHEHDASQDKHVKEHIICTADEHQMNRHHLSLFVRNCRLILLLRREFGDGDLKSFRPAEFRWKLAEVCDGQWHHYAVSMQFPEAQLYVDGRPFTTTKNNPEIIDDWPLHNSHGINTTTTVGACWQGSQNRMQHFMRGSMAGLSVLVGQTEQAEVIGCFHKCKENLETPPMELLQPGMEILNNNDLTELTLEGENKTNLELLLRRVGYANLRDFPTPGRRPLRVYTNIICASGRTLKIPALESSILVQATPLPMVTLTGTSGSHYDYNALTNGVRLFPDFDIQVSNVDEAISLSSSEEDEDDDLDEDDDEELAAVASSSSSSMPQRVDSCTATVYPPLNPDHESLTWPQNLVNQMKLEAKFSHDGVTLVGAESTLHYQQILRQLEYHNHKPAYYLARAFKLVCSQMNGRFASNELVHTVTVDHPQAVGASEESVVTSAEAVAATPSTGSTDKPSLPEKVPTFDSTAVPESTTFTTTAAAAAAVQAQQQAVQHQQMEVPSPAHVHIDRQHVSLPDAYLPTGSTPASSGHSVTIIAMVCIGFLMLMMGLGIARVRSVRRRAQQQQEEAAADTEMAWDDSALTITVNPMEINPLQTMQPVQKSSMTRRSRLQQQEYDSDDGHFHGHGSSDEDDDDDEEEEDDIDDDDDDDDEVGGTCGQKRDLEWDNSTLAI